MKIVRIAAPASVGDEASGILAEGAAALKKAKKPGKAKKGGKAAPLGPDVTYEVKDSPLGPLVTVHTPGGDKSVLVNESGAAPASDVQLQQIAAALAL